MNWPRLGNLSSLAVPTALFLHDATSYAPPGADHVKCMNVVYGVYTSAAGCCRLLPAAVGCCRLLPGTPWMRELKRNFPHKGDSLRPPSLHPSLSDAVSPLLPFSGVLHPLFKSRHSSPPFIFHSTAQPPYPLHTPPSLRPPPLGPPWHLLNEPHPRELSFCLLVSGRRYTPLATNLSRFASLAFRFPSYNALSYFYFFHPSTSRFPRSTRRSGNFALARPSARSFIARHAIESFPRHCCLPKVSCAFSATTTSLSRSRCGSFERNACWSEVTSRTGKAVGKTSISSYATIFNGENFLWVLY